MVIIPAEFEGMLTLKDGSWRIKFDTQEINPEQLDGLNKSCHKFGYLAFKPDQLNFNINELKTLENLKSDYEFKGKSNSKRLQEILYVNWQQNSKGYKEFSQYYDFEMNKIINHYKTKLDENI